MTVKWTGVLTAMTGTALIGSIALYFASYAFAYDPFDPAFQNPGYVPGFAKFWLGLSYFSGPVFLVCLMCFIYAWLADKKDTNWAYRYAESEGWLVISKHSFQKRRRNASNFDVRRAYSQKSYSLFIDTMSGESVVQGFEKALFAMRFADALYVMAQERQGNDNIVILPQDIEEFKAQWIAQNRNALKPGY